MENVRDMLTQIFTNFHPEIATQFVEGYLLIVIIMAAAYILHFCLTAGVTPSNAATSLSHSFCRQ